MSFKRFLIRSSGGPPVQWSGNNYAILKQGIMGNIHVKSRLAKCRQISIFAMPVAFTGKYQEIMENNGKYWQI